MNDKIRVAIVDDHPLFREGVAAILGNEPDFELVGQGASAEEAIRLAESDLDDESCIREIVRLRSTAMASEDPLSLEEIAARYPHPQTSFPLRLIVYKDRQRIGAAL